VYFQSRTRFPNRGGAQNKFIRVIAGMAKVEAKLWPIDNRLCGGPLLHGCCAVAVEAITRSSTRRELAVDFIILTS